MLLRDAAVLLVAAVAATAQARLVSVTKTIELSGALTRTNTGFTFDEPARHSVQLDGELEGYVKATTGTNKQDVELVRTVEAGKRIYTTRDPVSSFTLTQVDSHRSVADPPAQAQTDDITLSFSLNLLDHVNPKDLGSLDSLTVRVRCPSPRVLDIQSPKGFKHAHTKGSATVTFTPTSPLASLADSESTATIKYINSDPLASFTQYNRTVELSTFGSNINVHDSIVLFNSGPKLKGQFARIDHQRAMMMRKPGTSLNALSMALPPAAHTAYYYDTVGNVSTSRFTRGAGRKNAMLEFSPRYPLYGGWKYAFEVGWNLPLSEWEKRDGQKRVLRVDPFTPTRDLAVDHLQVHVRLPEGAIVTNVVTPYDYKVSYPEGKGTLRGVKEGFVKTYLDSIGRPVVTLERSNLTDRHLLPVFIEYELGTFDEYLRKPVTAAVVVSSVYVFVALLRRMRWSIS